MYIFGMCETILDDFGENGQLLPSNSTGYLPGGQWVEYGYGTFLLFLVGIICIVGSDIYAKATFGIFIVVGAAILSVISESKDLKKLFLIISFVFRRKIAADSSDQPKLAESNRPVSPIKNF